MFISLRLCQSSSFAVTSRAITPSLAITSTSSDGDKTMQSTSLSWAFDNWKMIASRLYLTSSSWWLLPMISRVQDSRLNIKPSPNMGIRREEIKRVGREESITKRRRVDNSRSMKKTSMSRKVSDGSDAAPISGCSSQSEHAKEIALPSSIIANITQSLSWYGQNSASPKKINETTKKIQQVTPDQTGSPSPSTLPLAQEQLQKHQYESEKETNKGQHPLRRVNSSDWIRDYKKERIDKINFNNVFGSIGDPLNNEIPALPEPPKSPAHSKHFESPVSQSSPTSKSSNSSTRSETSVVESIRSPPSPSVTASIHEPRSTDVICGRGGKANSHPGNVSFRAEAQKLRSWYESSSKSEKFTISSLLVDFVRERGGRFLKRGVDTPGNWSEADANDVRKKASQALREGRKAANNGA